MGNASLCGQSAHASKPSLASANPRAVENESDGFAFCGACTPRSDRSQTPVKFRVQLNKGSEPLGLDLDLKDGKTARITEIMGSGAVPSWNETCLSELRIMVGDHIVQVNGTGDDTNAMMRKLKQDSNVELMIVRPVEFKIHICKGDGLGVDFTTASNGTSLLVCGILTEGAIPKWNELSKNAALGVHDRIVEVNGTRGSWSALLEEVKSSEQLSLVVSSAPCRVSDSAIPEQSPPTGTSTRMSHLAA